MYYYQPPPLVPPTPEFISATGTIKNNNFGKVTVIPKPGYTLFGFYGYAPADGSNYKVFPTKIETSILGEKLEIFFYNDNSGTDVEMEVKLWQIEKPRPPQS
ncbi:hypothetical protein MOF23_07930 [Bacillus inaquosorum]|uniref:hypothetical protein n=1 Tax=Bacillus inaquosorum TaxID=483913 RepID=UPI00227F78DE|nr:hypothetical protein [Bacillus inaquosorum]MCY9308899.1 hypothetical protein [Bacillus inaquosorum]